jgi:hypothetical protein
MKKVFILILAASFFFLLVKLLNQEEVTFSNGESLYTTTSLNVRVAPRIKGSEVSQVLPINTKLLVSDSTFEDKQSNIEWKQVWSLDKVYIGYVSSEYLSKEMTKTPNIINYRVTNEKNIDEIYMARVSFDVIVSRTATKEEVERLLKKLYRDSKRRKMTHHASPTHIFIYIYSEDDIPHQDVWLGMVASPVQGTTPDFYYSFDKAPEEPIDDMAE